MVFKVTVEIDNAAFQPEAAPEVARILRETADRVEQGYRSEAIRDENGNTVGAFAFTR